MAIFKKILRNVVIVLAILIVICLLGIAVLFFMPSTNIFGLRWRKPAKQFSMGTGIPVVNGYVQRLKEDFRNVSKIVVNTGKIPVEIMMANAEDKEESFVQDPLHPDDPFAKYYCTLVEFSDQVSGLTVAQIKKDVNPFDLSISYNAGKSIATINLKEINGWFMYGKSKVTIKLPEDFLNNLNNKQVEVTTTSGDLVYNTGVTNLLDSLTYVTQGKTDLFSKKGSCTINSPLRRLDIKNINGRVDIGSDITGDLIINTKSSSINLKENISGNVTVETSNSKVAFKNINGQFNFYGQTSKKDVLDYASGGKITGDAVFGGIFVKTKNASTNLKFVEKNVTVDISNTGKVNLGLVNKADNINISGKNGEVKVTVADFTNCNITTNKGKIYLNTVSELTRKYRKTLTDITTSKDLQVDFVDTESIKKDGNKIIIKTNSGIVNFNDIDGLKGTVSYYGVEEQKDNKNILENYVRDFDVAYGFTGGLDITGKSGNIFVGSFGRSDNNTYNNILDNGTFAVTKETTTTKLGGKINVRVEVKGKAKVTARLFGFDSGSSISSYKGEMKVELKNDFPCYLINNCEKTPTIKVGLVDKFADGYVPTAIGGAIASGYTDANAKILTINNIKGKTNIVDNLVAAPVF